MTRFLKRYQNTRDLHFVTFSCYRRAPRLTTDRARTTFLRSLEAARLRFNFYVCGYVLMPEHIHLLISEPENETLAFALQVVKQQVARTLKSGPDDLHFWQKRYYDFNVWSEKKRIEKLRYMHRNPVQRGLCCAPEDWPWSSFRHYLTGEVGLVEIESQWTARHRETRGIFSTVKSRDV